ncbi:MAG: high-potential iron-sulfur protein [bacterium]
MPQISIEKMAEYGITRRTILQILPLTPIAVFFENSAFAGELPELREGDPVAQALGYTHVSDSREKNCANCGLYQGESGEEWGQCSIFPKKVVSASGWCKSWVASTG